MARHPVHSFDDYLAVLRRSRLVPEEKLAETVRQFDQQPGGRPKEAKPLAAALLREKLITAWQHSHLKDGRSKGFFLGRYKLLNFLGTGGMSTVYLAEHTLMSRRVAIKVLMEGQVEPITLERFRRECRAVASLDHPNIVRAHDFDTDGKFHYLVMEYVKGSDLHTVVEKQGVLAPSEVADYIRQAANGLAHAHESGMIHRDIKPANLLLSDQGVVKVLDMGVAKITAFDHSKLTVDSNQNLLGTVDFLAPEQALDSHEVDERADLYSLGCTMYFLLVGEPPFNKGTQAQRLLAHQIQPVPDIRRRRPDVPAGLVEICLKLLAKKPQQRYASAAELADTLQEWLDRSNNQAEPSSVIEASQTRDATMADTRANAERNTIQTSQPMIRIVCHSCQSQFGAPAQTKVRKIKCPHCGTVLALPAASEAPTAPAEKKLSAVNEGASREGDSPASLARSQHTAPAKVQGNPGS